jgi:hypothetical protein
MAGWWNKNGGVWGNHVGVMPRCFQNATEVVDYLKIGFQK